MVAMNAAIVKACERDEFHQLTTGKDSRTGVHSFSLMMCGFEKLAIQGDAHATAALIDGLSLTAERILPKCVDGQMTSIMLGLGKLHDSMGTRHTRHLLPGTALQTAMNRAVIREARRTTRVGFPPSVLQAVNYFSHRSVPYAVPDEVQAALAAAIMRLAPQMHTTDIADTLAAYGRLEGRVKIPAEVTLVRR